MKQLEFQEWWQRALEGQIRREREEGESGGGGGWEAARRVGREERREGVREREIG